MLVLYSEDDRGKLYILPSTGLVSPEIYIGSRGKGRKIIKMWGGYLVGWSCKNYEIMQKGVAHIWPFMKLGESVTLIPIQHVKSHIWSWIISLSF